MKHEDKTAMTVAFDQAKFEKDMTLILSNGYAQFGEGDKSRFRAWINRLLDDVYRGAQAEKKLGVATAKMPERPIVHCRPIPFGDGQTPCAQSGRGSAAVSSPNGLGHISRANGGQHPSAKPVAPRITSQDILDGRLAAKNSGANSLFGTAWLGKSIGAWSYRGIVAVSKDGEFARALLSEIGKIGEADKDRTLHELLGGSESRLRRVMQLCGRLPKRAA